MLLSQMLREKAIIFSSIHTPVQKNESVEKSADVWTYAGTPEGVVSMSNENDPSCRSYSRQSNDQMCVPLTLPTSQTNCTHNNPSTEHMYISPNEVTKVNICLQIKSNSTSI